MLSLFISASLYSQQTYDFETPTTSLTFQHFGSALDGTLTGIINNPDISGINTSTKVGHFVKTPGAQVWTGAFANPPSAPIDATSGGNICIKVWMDHSGSASIKVEAPEGGGENWITTQPYTTPNGSGNEVTTTILDFETPTTTTNFSYFGSSIDGSSTMVIANPNPSGINTSANVTAYTKPAVAQVWAGAYSNPNPLTAINLIGSNKVCLNVHMDHIGNVALKFEKSTSQQPNWIQEASNSKVNEWETICFDASLPSIETPFQPANSIFETAVIFLTLAKKVQELT